MERPEKTEVRSHLNRWRRATSGWANATIYRWTATPAASSGGRKRNKLNRNQQWWERRRDALSVVQTISERRAKWWNDDRIRWPNQQNGNERDKSARRYETGCHARLQNGNLDDVITDVITWRFETSSQKHSQHEWPRWVDSAKNGGPPQQGKTTMPTTEKIQKTSTNCQEMAGIGWASRCVAHKGKSSLPVIDAKISTGRRTKCSKTRVVNGLRCNKQNVLTSNRHEVNTKQ